MKTLADFKRRLVVGQVVEKTFHLGDLIVNGNTGQVNLRGGPKVMLQKVVKPQSQSVGFELLEGSQAGQTTWLQYPKAKDLKIVDADTAQVWDGGELILTYRFIQSEK